MRFLFWIILCSVLAAVPRPATAMPISSQAAENNELCHQAVSAAEQKFRLPKRLLTAISLTESGHWEKERREIIAWPWTVYAEGRGRYLPNKEAAILEVKKLRAKGVKNIDVGCMQVNLYYHPEAFEDLDEALDPEVNSQYAAELLKKLRNESRSWNIAVANYHSRNAEYNIPYRRKVMKIWQQERRKDTEARMAAAREEYRKRREALKERMREASRRRFTQTLARQQKSTDDAS